MAVKIVFNPISGQFDLINVASASTTDEVESFAFMMGG